MTLQQINVLRNIGQFDSVTPGAQLPLNQLSLIYAENGRGKTTFSAVLRSLRTGNSDFIIERNRLGAIHTPHVVLTVSGAQFQFQNGTWNATHPRIAIFDDLFVSQNICSGLEIDSEHRQKLHDLIIGAQGVMLNQTFQTHVRRIEQHNNTLREREAAIPPMVRGILTIEQFCALPSIPNIDQAIAQAERNLAAAQSTDSIRQRHHFQQIQLPSFDITAIGNLLGQNLANLNAEAARRVQTHIGTLGANGERWVAQGMELLQNRDTCPFCSQQLSGVQLIQNYQAYFSQGYEQLKRSIEQFAQLTTTAHGAPIQTAFERSVREAVEARMFWQQFVVIPEINIDTAAVVRAWNNARDMISRALATKQAAPLESLALSEEAHRAISEYETSRAQVAALSAALVACNSQIAIVKEQAAAGNVNALTNDLVRLRATQQRYSTPISERCSEYLAEKAAKEATEALRNQARTALDQYRQNVFPAYEQSINAYLQRFNAGFRLTSVTSQNTRSGSSSTYNVLINNVQVPLTANTGPSFRNTLSAGDRNALALAFFFASLESDPQLAQTIVVVDDPMTSLDEHRALTTVQEIRRLIPNIAQLIVLSHSKTFLCEIWDGADRVARSAMRITRDGHGSTFSTWDVTQDMVTEHDRRHALVNGYLNAANPSVERNVACALRPILESFVRVAYPNVFQPGAMLGQFIDRCRQMLNSPNPILNTNDINELRDLLDYANRFHHDTNAAWQTEQINDQELIQFCRRTLAFTRRS